MRNPRYVPLNEFELMRKLKVHPGQKRRFTEEIRNLEVSGRIARVKGDKWILCADAGLVTGVISFHEKGFAFLIPEDGADDIFIPAEETGTALHQDLVVVRLDTRPARRPDGSEKRQGRVIRILKRRRDTLVGTLEKTKAFLVVVPDDPRFLHDVYLVPPNAAAKLNAPRIKAEPGDKVVVRLLEWKSRHLNPEGVLVERLGKAGDPGVDILSIVRKHGLSEEFPEKVLAEVAKFDHRSPGRPEKDRLDLRNEFIITIDPDTAKDFDDAISLRELKDGLVEIGVHIADVSHYVRPGSALDTEAARRGNSTYLVNQVIPMLPEELSNGLCSLLPHVDRFTFSAFITVDKQGNMRAARFAKTVIHSKHRLTYQEALKRLSAPPRDSLDRFLHRAWEVASALRKARFRNGSLDLDFPEVKVRLDKNGTPVALEKSVNDISHQLIEEFMLAANETVARELKGRNIPTLYRVHENPDPEKLDTLRETLMFRGLKVGDLTKRHELQRVLALINKRPDGHALKISVLKSLKRADYRPQPLGHFGLAKINYTHFTSPIRRYSDLVVHRCLAKIGKPLSTAELAKIGAHLSQTERTSADAENESVKLKMLEYFQLQLRSDKPSVFEAVVTETRNFGFFVELPDYSVSGLVHLSALQDDFYVYDEKKDIIRGRKTKREIYTGATVKVRVNRIDLFKRQIDFSLA
jgi:ribonuclease R